MKKLIITTINIAGLILLSGIVSANSVSMDFLNAKSLAKLKLYVLDCGTSQTRDLSIFNPQLTKGKKMDMAVPCYVIQHPTKGTLVWDSGLQDEISKSVGGVELSQGAFHFRVKKTMLTQLQEIGLDPKDVTYFAPSHLHVDHSGNAHYFTSSTLLIQKNEYQTAFSKNAANYGYDISHYSKLKNTARISLMGDHDVFGDGSTIILSTPGHSPGHQSLYVKLPETGPIILSGDIYHFEENRVKYGIPVWNDKKLTIQSFARVDNILDNTSAKLWIQHDPEEAKFKRMSPDYYK